jgi:dTDP-4-amino-4,6-dideoxygalactose transaminase
MSDRILSLPMYPELPMAAVEEVAAAVRAFVATTGQVVVA